MKRQLIACSLLIWNVFAGDMAHAETEVHSVRQSYSALLKLWDNHIKPTQADAWAAYQKEYGKAADTGAGASADRGRLGGLWGEDEKPFTVLIKPIRSELAGLFTQRELALSMYLHHDSRLPPTPASDQDILKPEEVTALLQHRKEALLELYVLKLARYEEGTNFVDKCNNLTEAKAKRSDSVGIDIPVSNVEYQTLIDQLDTRSADYSEEIVCAAKPIGGRDLARVTQLLDQSILTSLSAEYKASIQPIADIQKKTFDTMLDGIYRIDPHSQSLFEFTNLLKNTEASMNLVANDVYKVRDMLPTLRTIDFDMITTSSKAGFVPLAVLRVQEAHAGVVTKLTLLASKLSKLPEAVAANRRAAIAAPCGQLETKLKLVFPTDPDVDPAQPEVFLTDFNLCLTAVNSYIRELRAQDGGLARLEIFAKHMKNLSKEMLILNK